MEYLNVTYPAVVIGNYKENIGQSYLWPQGTLYSFMALIDKAYECIEPLKESDPTAYEIYHEHILLESMFPRYANLKFYRATFSEEQFKQMAMQFKLDCSTVGITRESEEKTIDGLWTEWGV